MFFYCIQNIIKTKNANINLDTNLCTPLQQQNTQHEEEYWKKKYKVWKELADSGNSIAAQNIGIALYKGECGIQQDLSGAVYYFQMAANLGQPNSMFNLGWAYASGMGVPQSWQHAIRWWKLACFYGHGSAARNLGLLYTLGMIDITDDPSYMSCPTEKIDLYQKYNGFYYYLRAAELGNIKGMMALENCYRYGIGCKRDIELADFWYHRVINSSTSIQQKKVDAQHLTSSSTYTLQNSPRDDTFEESFQDKNPNLLNNICTNRPI